MTGTARPTSAGSWPSGWSARSLGYSATGPGIRGLRADSNPYQRNVPRVACQTWGIGTSLAQVSESEQAGLAAEFADIARRMQAETSPEKLDIGSPRRRWSAWTAATTQWSRSSAAEVPVETVAATAEVPLRVDALPYETGQARV